MLSPLSPSLTPSLWTIRRLMSEQLAGSTQHVCFSGSLFNHSLSSPTIPHFCLSLPPSLSIPVSLTPSHPSPPPSLHLNVVHGWCSVLFRGKEQHSFSVPLCVVSGKQRNAKVPGSDECWVNTGAGSWLAARVTLNVFAPEPETLSVS